jgi:hypothetical protein
MLIIYVISMEERKETEGRKRRKKVITERKGIPL